MSNNEPLKPCPFCGAAAQYLEITQGTNWVECTECGIETPTREQPGDTAALWNQRDVTEAAKLRIAIRRASAQLALSATPFDSGCTILLEALPKEPT